MASSWSDAEPSYRRPEHETIARLLRMTRTDLLIDSACWFAGGTAVVMKHGEYRLSADVDFLCSSRDGYSALRQAVTARGVDGLFGEPVKALRDFRCDRYGLRTLIEADGRPVKLEIVREGRIEVTGAYDTALGCPLLSLDDQFAEKLLANSDRGMDPSTCYRDALDLGMLVLSHGRRVPEAASTKALAAYGADIWRDASRVVNHLGDKPAELERAAETLRMDGRLARAAIAALRHECRRREARVGDGRV